MEQAFYIISENQNYCSDVVIIWKETQTDRGVLCLSKRQNIDSQTKKAFETMTSTFILIFPNAGRDVALLRGFAGNFKFHFS